MEESVRAEISESIQTKLSDCKARAEQELKQLCQDEQAQSITYNYYYTDKVQKARSDAVGKLIGQAMRDFEQTNQFQQLPQSQQVPFQPLNIATIKASLQQKMVVNMDEQACSEALVDLHAYYKVARKRFFDNVCVQVIERHLLRDLPDMFSATEVAGWSDEKLQQTAGERKDVVMKRGKLQAQLEMMQAGLKALRGK